MIEISRNSNKVNSTKVSVATSTLNNSSEEALVAVLEISSNNNKRLMLMMKNSFSQKNLSNTLLLELLNIFIEEKEFGSFTSKMASFQTLQSHFWGNSPLNTETCLLWA